MTGRDEMRAADADRQAAADRLRTALNEGRLDLHEYDERLRDAYAAKTYGELNRLLADLPATIPAERAQVVPVDPVVGDVAQPAAPAPGGPVPGATRLWLVELWRNYLSINLICVGIWFLTALLGDGSDLPYFWPGWVIGPWGLVLLAKTVTGLNSGEPQRRAARQRRQRRSR